MEEKIGNGITKSLFDEFDGEFSIYTENIEQGIKKPCFFVLHRSTEHKKLIMGRMIFEYGFEIKAMFSERKNSGIHSISNRITDALRVIDCDDWKINAEEIKFTNKEDIMTCWVKYVISARFEEDESELMEKLDIKEGE